MNSAYSWDNPFSVPLQWIQESEWARREYQCLCFRVNQAVVLGKPSENLYQAEMTSVLSKIPEEERPEDLVKACICVPEGRSFILQRAVENRANQMSGGVDTYEYTINDPFGIVDDETEDLLAAKCEQDYVENRLGQFSSTFSTDLDKYGVAAVLVKYDPATDKNDIFRINPKNIWFDTMYTSTGKERFRGYSTMISWKKLRKMIEDDLDEINTDLEIPDRSILNKNGNLDKRIKYANKKLTTLNDVDIYVEDMNKLANSTQLQGAIYDYWEYDHDLRNCYNLNWYRTLATDPEAKTKSDYQGDDVELTVMYDLTNKIEYKIINRRFVISANRNAFRREIMFAIDNPITDETTYRVDDFCLDCPLKFQFDNASNRDLAPYPISPLVPYLDMFDELCAYRAKRDHVSKLLSTFRIETNGADAATLRKTINLMGVILDDIQGDINSINFQYDYTPIDSEIQYREETIIKNLHAYDEFDALQSMGDRASAAESGMAMGAVAQGLATHQNAIMALYADIARQGIANRVAYSPNQEFMVYNQGSYSPVTIQQMALNAVVNVKSKLAKKIQERTLATNAITLVSNFKNILNQDGIAFFLEQAMLGQAPRKMLKSFIQEPGASEAETQNALLQAQNQAQMLQQNEQMYQQDPMSYETENIMQTQSPEDIDEIISQLNGGGNAGTAIEPDAAQVPTTDPGMEDMMLNMQGQEGATAPGLEGMTPDAGSAMANPNGFYG